MTGDGGDGPLDPAALARAGASRASALRGGAQDEPEQPFIRFELSGEGFAVPLEAVAKIERVPVITPVPRTPAFIRGITALRGEMVTVVDLASVLGGRESSPTPHGLLVLAHGTRRVGILSDVLPDYVRARASTLKAPPTGRGGDLICYALEREDRTLAVIDVGKLMDVLEKRMEVA